MCASFCVCVEAGTKAEQRAFQLLPQSLLRLRRHACANPILPCPCPPHPRQVDAAAFEEGLGLAGKELLAAGVAGMVADVQGVLPYFSSMALSAE